MQTIKASIITIGDELLIGQVIDTNSAWIAQELNKIGIWVHRRIAVGDVSNDIRQALDDESAAADVILITGGLGPTDDDITKPALSEYFGGKLIMHEDTLAHITYLFEHVFKRPVPLLERNRKQAEVPDVCTVLKNEAGTAPGMLFEKNGKVFISIPGVPYEMKHLMLVQVLPLLKARFDLPYIGHRTLLAMGIGESFLAERIQDFEKALPGNIKLAYLPNFGMIRLRLTARGRKEEVEQQLNKTFNTLKTQVKDVMVIDEDISFEMLLGRLLKEKRRTVSTAESCTGGYIAHLITSVAGSSAYFKGSVVSYDNSIKRNLLHVTEDTLLSAGAVSEETVKQMVTGALDTMDTDYAVAVSGIMGPDGGTAEKPVGTVWIAAGNNKRTEAKKFNFRFDRERNIQITGAYALHLLCTFIRQDN